MAREEGWPVPLRVRMDRRTKNDAAVSWTRKRCRGRRRRRRNTWMEFGLDGLRLTGVTGCWCAAFIYDPAREILQTEVASTKLEGGSGEGAGGTRNCSGKLV